MKTPIWMSLAVSLGVLGSQAAILLQGSAIAQTLPTPSTSVQASVQAIEPASIEPLTAQPQLLRAAAASTQSPIIPADTGIIVSFLAPVAIDADEGAYPMTLPLGQAITDAQGNVLVPENSPVSVVLQPEDGGARVVAQSIVINGKIVPIQATSPIIPGTTITHMRASQRAAENGSTFGRIAATGFGFFGGGDPDEFDRGAMLGTFVGMLSGRRDESTRVVQIPQGSVYVLPLAEAVTLSQ